MTRATVKGKVPGQQHIQQHAERPHVALFPITGLEDDLRCEVQRCAARGVCDVVDCHMLGEAKVGHDELRALFFAPVHQILWLDVAMNDAFRVYVSEDARNRADDVSSVFLGKVRVLRDAGQQVSSA